MYFLCWRYLFPGTHLFTLKVTLEVEASVCNWSELKKQHYKWSNVMLKTPEFERQRQSVLCADVQLCTRTSGPNSDNSFCQMRSHDIFWSKGPIFCSIKVLLWFFWLGVPAALGLCGPRLQPREKWRNNSRRKPECNGFRSCQAAYGERRRMLGGVSASCPGQEVILLTTFLDITRFKTAINNICVLREWARGVLRGKPEQSLYNSAARLLPYLLVFPFVLTAH